MGPTADSNLTATEAHQPRPSDPRHHAAMDDPSPPPIDRTKVRLGLALIAIVLVVALVLVFVVAATIVKALMFAIAVTAFVRVFLLARSLRSDPPQRGSS
jgi:hypothetical protein